MQILFAATLFLSAALLFMVEPMTAKRLLPLLGGSPAVWNTCMVFYQAVLLAGYAYAHVLSHRFCRRRQVLVHGLIVAAALLALPLGVQAHWQPPRAENPIPWLLAALALSVGLPFFALSANGPLLQRWLADTGHRAGRDPYFLFAASNLGSLLALASYPVVIERFLPLGPGSWWSQSWLWAAGYALLATLAATCAWVVWHSPAGQQPVPDTSERATPIGPGMRVRWVTLAFLPSSLMLGVTTYITMDLAAIPLLWVVPLGLYLLSFVFVFTHWPARVHAFVIHLVPAMGLLTVVLMLAKVPPPGLAGLSPAAVGIALHLLTLFVVSLGCHGELARTRPPACQLTGFYLGLSLGGVLGGLFNALVAPVLFSSVVEYPLMLVATCFLLPGSLVRGKRRAAMFSGLPGFLVDLGVATLLAAVALWLAHEVSEPPTESGWWADALHHVREKLGPGLAMACLAFGLPALVCCMWASRPVRLGLSVGGLALAAAVQNNQPRSESLYRDRDFFGIIEVRHDPRQHTYSLWHGSTLHGEELRSPGRPPEPVAYYHASGPLADAFRTLPQARGRRVAVIGLGAGCLAAFGHARQHMTFYEIDPAVLQASEHYFGFLKSCQASWEVVLGDGRLRMNDAPDGSYDLIILDAFSSDAVPVHLITREAFQMYFRKLTSNGVILVNITNRYLDLRPVLGNLGRALGVTGRYRKDVGNPFPLKVSSTWAVLARRPSDLDTLPTVSHWSWERNELAFLAVPGGPAAAAAELVTRFCGPWQPLPTDGAVGVWRDDYSNLLSVFR